MEILHSYRMICDNIEAANRISYGINGAYLEDLRIYNKNIIEITDNMTQLKV